MRRPNGTSSTFSVSLGCNLQLWGERIHKSPGHAKSSLAGILKTTKNEARAGMDKQLVR